MAWIRSRPATCAANCASPRRAPGAPWIPARAAYSGARAHNLKAIDVDVPLGMMVAVTGVFRIGQIHPGARRDLPNAGGPAERRRRRAGAGGGRGWRIAGLPRVASRKVEGAERIAETVMIDQSPIGRTPRSNPVTYIKAFEINPFPIRLPPAEAVRRGYTPGHFSFNIPGGLRHFARARNRDRGDAVPGRRGAVCEAMQGTRFKSGILEIPLRRA